MYQSSTVSKLLKWTTSTLVAFFLLFFAYFSGYEPDYVDCLPEEISDKGCLKLEKHSLH